MRPGSLKPSPESCGEGSGGEGVKSPASRYGDQDGVAVDVVVVVLLWLFLFSLLLWRGEAAGSDLGRIVSVSTQPGPRAGGMGHMEGGESSR